MTTDGIAIDDINVCAKPAQPSYISGPIEHCTFDWEEYNCPYVSGATEYDWTINGIATLNEDGSRYVEVRSTMEGYYTLQVRAKNVCGQWGSYKSKSIWIDACGGPQKVQGSIFNIHPNPTNDFINVSLSVDKLIMDVDSEGFVVNVYNQIGNLVISEKTNGTSVGINTSRLQNGTYVFKIAYQGNIYSYEIIVQH